MVSEPREKKNPNYFRFIRESILWNLSVTVFHSGHLSHLLKLTDQPYRRQKTLTVGDFSSDLFPAKSFSDTDHTIKCARKRSSSFVKAPEGDSQPRVFLLQRPESHALAREGAWSIFRPRASTSILTWRRLATLLLCLCPPIPTRVLGSVLLPF